MTTRAALISQQTIYEGRILDITVDRVRMPNGREVSMEVIRHPGSVVLLAMPDPGRVILVRQYRYVIDEWIWELPAGSVDKGEEPPAAAARECHEEIGLVPATIEPLGTFYPSPGTLDEKMTFFRLTGLTVPDRRAEQDEDEDLEPRVVSLADANRMVREGEIVDMKTVVGLALLRSIE